MGVGVLKDEKLKLMDLLVEDHCRTCVPVGFGFSDESVVLQFIKTDKAKTSGGGRKVSVL